MKRTIRDAIIEARLTDEMINTFIGQIAVCSILGGLYFGSWIVFGLLLLLLVLQLLFDCSKCRLVY